MTNPLTSVQFCSEDYLISILNNNIVNIINRNNIKSGIFSFQTNDIPFQLVELLMELPNEHITKSLFAYEKDTDYTCGKKLFIENNNICFMDDNLNKINVIENKHKYSYSLVICEDMF